MKSVNKNDVINAINKIIKERGHFPNQIEIADELFIPVSQVHKCMMALTASGYLARVGNWYRLSYNDSDQSVSEETLLQDQKDYSILILKILMIFIGVGAVSLSIYYTSIWMIEFLPIVLAILLSTIMIGFSISIFEVLLIMRSQGLFSSRITKFLVTITFSFLWVIVTSFSIMSTVAGQFNKNIENIQDKSKVDTRSDRLLWNSLQDRKNFVQSRIGDTRKQVEVLNAVLRGMSSFEDRKSNDKVWRSTQYELRKCSSEISELSSELDKIVQEERLQIESSRTSGNLIIVESEEQVDFYGWIGSLFSLRKALVQFWMNLFPALFIDIIAPISFAVALFLNSKSLTKNK